MSTYPVGRTVVNQSFTYVSTMIEDAAYFRSLAARISAKSIELFGTRRISAEQKQVLMTHLKEEQQLFLAKTRAAKTVEPPPLVAPPPPPRNELYGRIADGMKITDVGSGDDTKLRSHSGRLRITCVDPKLESSDVTVTRVPRPVEACDISGLVTSFNVLPQLDPDSAAALKIVESDGLHVIPDHDVLLGTGCAKKVNDKVEVLVVKDGSHVTYKDYYINFPGYETNGYKICPFYQKRTLRLPVPRPPDVIGPSPEGTNYTPKIQAAPAGLENANWADMTWKYDGEAYELESDGDKIYLTARNGELIEVDYSCGVKFCIHMEYVPECACFVLFRVVMYNGFIPPHSGELLRHFTSKVHIDVGGLPVVAPPRLGTSPVLNGCLAPVDGVIFREEQMDYYCKKVWTLDLYPSDIARTEDTLRAAGWEPNVECIGAGLHEYQLMRMNGVATLRPVRQRYDKKVATSQSTVARILSLPTLSEMLELYGATPLACPLLTWC